MRRISVAALSVLLVLGLASVASAGPGSVVIKTEGDITATFGAQVRMVPTFEKDWDFGIFDKTGNNRFISHINEAGAVNKNYIRSEDRLYFNFAKGKIWDAYFALEFDDVLSSRTTDRVRDVQGNFGTFGLERLNASINLPWIYSRLNAGWDNYFILDVAELGSLVYGDDDPGFYLKGGIANVGWLVGYHKKGEANRVLQGIRGTPANVTNASSDNDHDIISARLDYTLMKDTQAGLIFAWNQLHGGVTRGSGNVDSDPCAGPVCPETDGYYISPFVKFGFAGWRVVAQYSHLWGGADKTGVGDFDISSNAAYADVSFDVTPWTGFRTIPHVGFWWTQGDGDPTDNKLRGYTGVTNFQRFTSAFGGENTIIADGNAVYGSVLYGFLPDQHGNQDRRLVAGGTDQTGRGDNPGILIVGGGVTVEPIKNWSYRTNAYYLRYNENFCPASAFSTLSASGACPDPVGGVTTKKSIGVAWDNEVSWWLDKNMVVKGQFSFLFPTGDTIKQITRQLSGRESDDVPIRLAAELLWNF